MLRGLAGRIRSPFWAWVAGHGAINHDGDEVLKVCEV
jgi:hypothetical protein